MTHLPARFYKLVRVVRAISPAREGIIWPLDSLILSYQVAFRIIPSDVEERTFLVKAPVFELLSDFARL
jgi:hypothetical protein